MRFGFIPISKDETLIAATISLQEHYNGFSEFLDLVGDVLVEETALKGQERSY